ncbi:MAG: hypothetical protein ACM3JB_08905 [Acidobacteriaceae bacterium]
MSHTWKKESKIIRDRKEIRFGGVHIDLIGPADLAHNEEAKDAAIDFLRTEILATRGWLKDCGKISPVLKRFKVKAYRTCIIHRCPTCVRHRRNNSSAKENRL